METVTVKAFTGEGDEKVLVGEREISVAQNVDEAIKVYGSMANLLDFALRSYVIEVQRQIRSKTSMSTKKKVNQIVERAKELKEEGDDSLFNECVRLGIIAK